MAYNSDLSYLIYPLILSNRSENHEMMKPDKRQINIRNSIANPPFMFSVVITTYNRASLLKRALDSLIAQKEKDWEAIVVDDGSTDQTKKAIAPLLHTHTKIRYNHIQHSGAIPAKNKGIEVSTGQFITFLDSDDEYDPYHLEYRKKVLNENPALKFVYGGVKILGNPYVPDKDNPSTRIHLNQCVIGGSFVIERSFLLSLHGFQNLILGSDADLFERIQKANIPMLQVTQPTYIYHHENPDSTTNKMYRNIE